MRNHAGDTRWLLVLALVGPAQPGSAPSTGALPAAAQPATSSAPATRTDAALDAIDAALAKEQWALALDQVAVAVQQRGPEPALRFRAARAYFGLGQVLGAVDVREVPDGRPGQFVRGWLLLERRGPRRFLCVPEASALNQLRRALDAGLDTPAAHLLHARLWQAAGKPQVGFSLLKSREALLLESGMPDVLETFCDLALDADALDDFLRFSQRQAGAAPDRRADILSRAYVKVAEKYGQRGETALYAEFLHRALWLCPDDPELMLQAADAEWSADRRDAAATLYTRLLKLRPDHPQRAVLLERARPQLAPATPASQPVP